MIDVVQILEATDGGTRTHILQLLRGLDRARFRQTLIASAERNPLFREDMAALRLEGIETFDVAMVRNVSPFKDIAALRRLISILQKRRDAVIHTHASKAGALGRIAARIAGCRRVVHTPHVFYFEGKRGASRAFYRRIERVLAGFTTRMVLLTPTQRYAAVNELGIDPLRAAVIANGVDIERFRPGADKARAREALGLPADAPAVGCITRFMPQKGNRALLASLVEVFRRVPAARAVIVGDGPDRDAAMRTAEESSIRERINWIRRIERPEGVYAALDVFALASLYEGMPYTLLEAMAMETAVVATNVPGCADVIEDGISGFLADPNDSGTMAERIVALLEGPSARREVGAAARRRVMERFQLKRFLADMEALYESVAAGKS